MTTHVRPSATVVELEDGWTLQEVPAARPGMRGAAVPVPDDALLHAMTQQDFAAVDAFDLVPPTAGLRSATATAPRGRVTVAPGTHAVMLVERGGVYEWVLPNADALDATRTRGLDRAVARELVFDLSGGRSRASARGSGALARVRAWVLRFVAEAVTPLTIALLERHVQTRLVDLRPADPLAWSTLEAPVAATAPRVLLFVHGTFSSTSGAFCGLAATEPGRAFLAWARERYDEVIGYDHATLSVDPGVNAADLLARLAERYDGVEPSIDIVAHSRGGLVARSLVEVAAPAAGSALRFERLVLVGCTNDGTHLAEPQNWKLFVDIHTNLASQFVRTLGAVFERPVVGALLDAAMRSVGALVKFLAVHAVDEAGIPGLAAMKPRGDFVLQLNRVEPGASRSRTFVVQAEFEPAHDAGASALPLSVLMWLADHLADDLFGGIANDLVVDTRSMAAVDPEIDGAVEETFGFGAERGVHHLGYFLQADTIAAMRRWFGDPPT